ncbi:MULTISPECIES: hypothetical protein [Salipiger]|uniref:Uncharacterized protein n=1 Tax=Salipiger profundus TaxID=1229727 RepID=A0A1U7DDM1_9RHOB|nr:MULTISPECIES: hypothetical protein [Salipiger]APX26277.1 hypothetical protein Ga0080559_TMP5177 [Salipiger profundus]GGA21265.1 hypothetical protein GCM10011326_37310 [Salipiger profundus]
MPELPLMRLDHGGLPVVFPGGTLARQLLVLPQEGRELLHLQVMSKQDLRSTDHAVSPASRDMSPAAEVVPTSAGGK